MIPSQSIFIIEPETWLAMFEACVPMFPGSDGSTRETLEPIPLKAGLPGIIELDDEADGELLGNLRCSESAALATWGITIRLSQKSVPSSCRAFAISSFLFDL